MQKKQKIVLLGGLVGILLGVTIGVLLARRAAPGESPAGPPDGRKLLKVGTALMALVRLIQEL